MKTVLITGCSSGYGLETARYFHSRGWTVIATMRRPVAGLFPDSNRIRVLALDVTDPDSIADGIAAAGAIDVLVNNAGIGVVGAFEATPIAMIRDVFDTNVFGTLAMTQAVIPQMRERRSGTIINVTSPVCASRACPWLLPTPAARPQSRALRARSRTSSARSMCGSSWWSRATARPRGLPRMAPSE